MAIPNSAGKRLANFLLTVEEQSPAAYRTCGDYVKYVTEYGLPLIELIVGLTKLQN